ncbi:43909_t:CDS:2, partial [Gigaspora margarita]
TNIENQDVEMNQYAHGFGVAKSRLKFALENGLVNEFVGLISRFIENLTGIENLKKLKHKRHSKIPKSTSQGTLQDVKQDLNTRQNLNLRPKKLKQTAETDSEDKNFEENLSSTSKKQVNKTDNENFIPKVEGRHCSNCYGTEHYASTYTHSKNHFR